MPSQSGVDLAQFPVLLEVQPERRRSAEGPAQQDGHSRRHAAPPATDLVDPRDVGLQMPRQSGLGNPPLIQHFLEDLAGVDRDWKITVIAANRHFRILAHSANECQ